MPISSGEKPSTVRWTGSSTATKPSPKSQGPRAQISERSALVITGPRRRAEALWSMLIKPDLSLGSATRGFRPKPKEAVCLLVEALPVRWEASPFGACGPVERRANSLGQFYGVVIGPEMHEEQARLVGEHVAMDGSDLDAVCL